MKTTFDLFKSGSDFVKNLDWAQHSKTGYVLLNPSDSNSLIYLTKVEYEKLLRVALSNDYHLVVIARPNDTPASILARTIDGSSIKEEPKIPLILENLGNSRIRLFNLVSGWKVSDSMISIKRNFNQFIPITYRTVSSWLGIAPTSGHLRDAWSLSRSFDKIFSSRGINQVISRLKIELFVLNSYIAETPLRSTQQLGQRIRLTNGLPAHWPLSWRQNVRAKNIPFIRLYSTILQSYKALAGKYGKPDLSTISSPPYQGFKTNEPWAVLPYFTQFMKYPKGTLESVQSPNSYSESETRAIPNLRVSIKAGPNHKIAILGLMSDISSLWAQRFDRVPNSFKLYGDDVNMFSYFENFHPFIMNTIHTAIKYVSARAHPSLLGLETDPRKIVDNGKQPSFISGKLSLKYEAAGKIRVFAIVDYWTQMALKPLHEHIFKILAKNPCDATFNQNASVQAFSKRLNRTCYSFDLKSATDLIPRDLYQVVLTPILGKAGAAAWIFLLTNRKYWLNGKSYTYTRGQPMGALSSWAALALVHHYLVFLSATRVYGPMAIFTDYMILGDDIVIADSKVAQAYVEVCEEYGVTIGLPKSFQSPAGFFQFASRNMIYDTDISPISIKEALAAQSMCSRAEFGARMVLKDFISRAPMDLLRATVSYGNWRKISKELTRGIISTQVRDHLLTLLSSIMLKFSELDELNKVYLRTILALLQRDYHSIVQVNTLLTKYSDRRIHIFGIHLFHLLRIKILEVVADKYRKVREDKSWQDLPVEDFAQLHVVSTLMRYNNIQDMFQLRKIEDDLVLMSQEFASYSSSLYQKEQEYPDISFDFNMNYIIELLDLLGRANSLLQTVSLEDLKLAKAKEIRKGNDFLSKDLRLMHQASEMFESIHLRRGR